MGRSLLHNASVPYEYWNYAFDAALHTINRLPNSIHDRFSPFEILFRTKPNYDELRVFGSLCYPWLKPYAPHKLAPKSSQCVFLGYSKLHKGYICLDIQSRRKFISRHVLFYEQVFPFRKPSDNSISTTSIVSPTSVPLPPIPQHSNYSGILGAKPSSQPAQVPTSDVVPFNLSQELAAASPRSAGDIVPTAEPVTPTSASHERQPFDTSSTPGVAEILASNDAQVSSPPQELIQRHQMVTRRQTGSLKPRLPWSPTLNLVQTQAVPTCFTQANKDTKWREAMVNEINALLHTHTWDLVPRSQAQNIVGCKWVFRLKEKADGSIDKYKARLVAKGFHQRPGIDFKETFSPVIKPTTIRMILSLAVSFNWKIKQLDVSNAFLHGDLDIPVFMEQPPGFIDQTKSNYVCRLRRSLYGLRQAPRQWYSKLVHNLTLLGFTSSNADSSLFIFRKGEHVIFLLVYVDDILVTGSDPLIIQHMVTVLQAAFSIKDLGTLDYFLGMEASWQPAGLLLTQRKYIQDLLVKAKMKDCKGLTTPASVKDKATIDGRSFDDPTLYRSIVGGLQYLSLTRPEVCYSVHRASQFMHNPTEENWSLVKRILRYLQATSTYGLFISKSPTTQLNVYCDADWASSTYDRKSTSGFAIFMGRNLISWSSRKQRTVAKSSTEAEYRALGLAIQELVWVQSLLCDIGFASQVTPNVWCDNIGATYLSANPVFHNRSKHLEVEFHFIRDKVQQKEIQVRYICSKDQLADILTKPLPKARHKFLMSQLSIRSFSTDSARIEGAC